MGSPCHFALFDLKPSFRLDLEQVATRYRELARAVHPDRFADAGERDKRVALERSAELNEAYQTLRSPPRQQYTSRFQWAGLSAKVSRKCLARLAATMAAPSRLASKGLTCL